MYDPTTGGFIYSKLGGGFKYMFICTPMPGEMIQCDDCAYLFLKWVGEKTMSKLYPWPAPVNEVGFLFM